MRESRGLSQAELAVRLGRSQQAVSSWEKSDPSLGIVAEVVEELDITSADLRGELSDISTLMLQRLVRQGSPNHEPDPEPPAASGLPPDDEYWIAAKSGASLDAEDRQVIVDMVRRLRARQE